MFLVYFTRMYFLIHRKKSHKNVIKIGFNINILNIVQDYNNKYKFIQLGINSKKMKKFNTILKKKTFNFTMTV